jgi:hypothetical protein
MSLTKIGAFKVGPTQIGVGQLCAPKIRISEIESSILCSR